METPTKNKNSEPAAKRGFFGSSTHLLVLIVVFLLLLVGALVIKQNKTSAPTMPRITNSNGPSLSLAVSQTKLQPGSEIAVDVWEDSGNQPVNAVQANIKYPVDQFKFVSINPSKGSFEIEAQSTGKNGAIIIARGHRGSLTGRQLVATVKLKVIGDSGSTSLSFQKGSALLEQVSNKDILARSTGLNFTIEAN